MNTRGGGHSSRNVSSLLIYNSQARDQPSDSEDDRLIEEVWAMKADEIRDKLQSMGYKGNLKTLLKKQLVEELVKQIKKV